MSQPPTKQVSQLTQIMICVIFVVLVRIYYAIVESNSQAIYPWFANHPWRVTSLYLLAIPAAVGGALAIRGWFSAVLTIPTGIACGALVTLPYSSLPGGLIGFCCGLGVFSTRLRSFAKRLVRPTVVIWIPGLLFGILLGLVVAYVTLATDRKLELLMMITQWCLVLAMTASATWKIIRSDSITPSRSVRCLIAMGFLFSLLIGLTLGPIAETQIRIRQLMDVATIQGFWSVDGAFVDGADDDDISKLRGFPETRWLRVSNSTASSETMSRVLASLPNLFHVNLHDVVVDKQAVRALRSSKTLSSLTLVNTGLSVDALKEILLMPSLRYLSIDGMQRNGQSLPPFTKLGGLTSLTLKNVELTDGDLANLSGLRGLTSLKIKNGNLTGTGLRHLQQLARLDSLEIVDCPLDAGYVTDLIALKLNWLTLNGISFNDEAAEAIGSMNSLIGVSLRRTGLTDEQVIQFDRLQSPQLILDASRLSIASRATLRQADEVELYFEGDTVTAKDIQRLDELGIHVTFDACKFTEEAISELTNRDGRPHFAVLNSDLRPDTLRLLNDR